MGNVTINLDEFKKKVTSYNRKDWDIIEKAYFYAEKYHKNQKRVVKREIINLFFLLVHYLFL